MYSDDSCVFSGNNTVNLFIHALMDGIILKDKPSMLKGVCQCARSAEDGRNIQARGGWESLQISMDKECVQILGNGVKSNTRCCDSDSGKRTCLENERQETGSRTKKYFRLFGHFRSFEWRLVLFSFMLLIHGIG